MLIFLFFGILSSLFFQLSKNKLKMWGKKREGLDKSISKIIIESLGNIRGEDFQYPKLL